MTKARVERFLNEFSQWASEQSHIQGVALVGSHARGTATETSDVDLVVPTDQPRMYLQDRTWIQAFGAVIDEQVENYGNVTSLRIRTKINSKLNTA
jgi:predicted nucleotidyltransferase